MDTPGGQVLLYTECVPWNLSPWCSSGAVPKQSRRSLGAVLEQFRSSSGATLEQFLMQFWSSSEAVLEQFWSSPGAVLALSPDTATRGAFPIYALLYIALVHIGNLQRTLGFPDSQDSYISNSNAIFAVLTIGFVSPIHWKLAFSSFLLYLFLNCEWQYFIYSRDNSQHIWILKPCEKGLHIIRAYRWISMKPALSIHFHFSYTSGYYGSFTVRIGLFKKRLHWFL